MSSLTRRLLTPQFILLGCFCGSIFLFNDSSFVSGAPEVVHVKVVISEIKSDGGTGKSTDEYIELYNPEDRPISMDGWKLARLTKNSGQNDYTFLIPFFPTSTKIDGHGYFLIAHHDYVGDSLPDIHYDGSSLADDNSIVLLDEKGHVVDLVGYGKAINVENQASLAPTSQLLSIERLPGGKLGNGQDTNNNLVDFIRAYPTPQNSFSISAVFDDLMVESTTNESQDLVSSTDDYDEEISVIGSSSVDIVLESVFSSSTVTTTTVSSTTSLIVTSTIGQELLVVTSSAISVLESNSISILKPGDVLISELVSYPTTGEEEFIELFNRTDQVLNLSGTWIEDGSGVKSFITSTVNSLDRIVLTKPKGALNNDGDIIILKSLDGTTIDTLTYGNWDDGSVQNNAPAPAPGESIVRVSESGDTNNDRNDFVVTRIITKGRVNTISIPTQSEETSTQTAVFPTIQPRIVGSHKVTKGEIISLDAGDSTGGTGDLMFHWDFGDGSQGSGEYIEHGYNVTGSYRVVLMVHDVLGNSKTKIWTVRVVDQPQKNSIITQEGIDIVDSEIIKENLLISEILPSPLPGGVEYVELYNQGSSTLVLSGLFLDNAEGGSKPFLIPPKIEISPKQYRVFSRYETGINLRPVDQVRILGAGTTEIVSVAYTDAQQNSSYNWLDGKWQWSEKITPGKPNEINLEDDETKDQESKDIVASTSTKKVTLAQDKKTQKSTKTIPESQAGFVTMSGIDEVKLGNFISLMGIVVAAPGSYLTREFYMVTDNDEPNTSNRHGIRVQYKKDAPPILVGDAVTVTGEIQEKSGDRLVVVSNPEYVVIRRHAEKSEPQSITIQNLLGKKGGFFSLEGIITEIKKQTWYIDDGSGEIQIILPKKVEKQVLGDRIGVTGILTFTDTNGALRPRDASDIRSIATTTPIKGEIANESEVKKMYGIIGLVLFVLIVTSKKINFFKRKKMVETVV